MGKKLQAVGSGLKHFFGAAATRDAIKSLYRRFKQGNKVDKAQVVAVAGLFLVLKGSPVGLTQNILSSIRHGKSKHDWLARHEDEVDQFLATTGISAAGQQAVMEAIRNGSMPDDTDINLSAADAQAIKQAANDIAIAAGKTINF